MLYLIFIIIIINYIRTKSQNIIYISRNLQPVNETQVKLLTFNCQRLPYLFRPNVNIENLIKEYDIICLQENFCSIFGFNKKKYYNYIHPAGLIYKIVDSGLSIYSKYKIEFIDFIRFNNLKSIDKISDKGFLVIKLKDVYIINTHLQANYTKEDNETAKIQLNTIIDYIKLNNIIKVVICGDFNINLNELILSGYNISFSNIPTHWEKITNSIFNSTSSEEKKDMIPCYFDGFIDKNITITNIQTKKIDNYSDHLGVSIDIQI